MRKIQQQQVLELLKTMREAADEIEKFILSGQINEAIQVMGESQDFALSIGAFIEAVEGKSTKTVSFLEEYCKILYEASCKLTSVEKDNLSLRKIKKHINVLENSVRQELYPNKIEIVFFPYNASVWDSMESIWKAASADSNCDVFVVPIPYYDKLPDGSYGQVHFEGHLYPEEVKVVNWQSYNVKERKPDIIFTNSPYDGDNFVTSIHPDFYCEKLKEYTSLLVYVPYFVCVDDVEEHFCVCAGTLYSDKVIVQSEKIRKTYISTFKKFEKEANCKGIFGKAEDKFVALGSPKFDKAINSSCEESNIPEYWKDKIAGEGGKKKVVLYNTSIATLLENDYEYILKLKDVFEFYKKQSDVALIWRPHPLSEATYQAMRPQLLKEYNNVVEQFKGEDWGIYDDNADLYKAMSVSDAYYGDHSSLTALYHISGKPVMIQNIANIKNNEAALSIPFEYLHDDGEYLWFTAYFYNALFRMKKNLWEPEYMGSFPEERAAGFRLFSGIGENGGKLYFAPFNAKAIGVYNKNTGGFERIEVNEALYGFKNDERQQGAYFRSLVKHEDNLFLIPLRFPTIIKLDTVSKEITYIDNWVKPLQKTYKNTKDDFLLNGGVIIEDKLYCVSLNSNIMLVLDIHSGDYDFIKIGRQNIGYSCMCFDGNNFWLGGRKEKLIAKLNINTKETVIIETFPEGFESNIGLFNSMWHMGNSIFAFPATANMVLEINIENTSVRKADFLQEESGMEKTVLNFLPFGFSSVIRDNENFYAYAGKANYFVKYNYTEKTCSKEYIILNEENMKKLAGVRLRAFCEKPDNINSESDCNYYENNFFTTEEFIDYIKNNDFSDNRKIYSERVIQLTRESNCNANGFAGEEIFSYCKKLTGVK